MYYYRRIHDIEGLRIIYVTFSDYNRLSGFNDLLELWKSQYIEQRRFRFVFDTRGLKELPSLYYCFQMAWFIRRLKKDYRDQYLERSLILVNRVGIRRLLDFIFTIQSPVAPVYIYHCEGQVDPKQMTELVQQSTIQGEDITEILP